MPIEKIGSVPRLKNTGIRYLKIKVKQTRRCETFILVLERIVVLIFPLTAVCRRDSDGEGNIRQS